MTQPRKILDDKDLRIPPGTTTVGMWLFLASLTMLFAAGMLGYFAVRFMLPNSANLHRTHLSPIFWVSTTLVVLGSVTIQFAVAAIRREHQLPARRWIWLTFVLAILFCVVQTPALADLWRQQMPQSPSGSNIAKLIAAFIVIHALHVLGGVIGLTIVGVRASRNAYDHENYAGLKHAAMYWHFLDVVWAVMFSSMLICG